MMRGETPRRVTLIAFSEPFTNPPRAAVAAPAESAVGPKWWVGESVS
jgi:hypothetical protein